MVDYFSTTALSEIINNNLEESPTSIDLLLLRGCSTNSNSVLEVDDAFQQDILDHIVFNGPNIDGLNNGAQLTASCQQPFLQIL
jgi:hypothetical protein